MTEKKPITETTAQNQYLDKHTYSIEALDKPEPKLVFAEDTDGVCREENETFTVINTIAGGFDNIKLVTYANEVSIPHFHFYKGIAPENDVPVHTPEGGCICFETLNYYHHGSHIDSLTKEELADMIAFLKQKNLTDPSRTNWVVLIDDWNRYNSYNYMDDHDNEYGDDYYSKCGIDRFVSEDLEIPDYTSDMGVIKGKTTFINTETGETFIEYADEWDILKDAGVAYHEMVCIGGFDDIRIAVSGEDCGIPYFRFYKDIPLNVRGVPYTARHKGGCICITSPNYFSHDTHMDTMSRKEIERLIEFLKMPHNEDQKTTNWAKIICWWNRINYEQTQIPIDLKIPDYTAEMDSIKKPKEGK